MNSPSLEPDLQFESTLLARDVEYLACLDEVGRGALAGPVALGAVLISRDVGQIPAGLRDSKLLTARSRNDLLPKIQGWVLSHSVGFASAAEIDDLGIIGAMRVAGVRALEQLSPVPDLILLDGNHDYLSSGGVKREITLFDVPDLEGIPPVVTKVKADMTCAGVAAASVVAKCARDALMIELASKHPGYSFEKNKGYSSPDHIQGLHAHGLSEVHRHSWKMPA